MRAVPLFYLKNIKHKLMRILFQVLIGMLSQYCNAVFYDHVINVFLYMYLCMYVYVILYIHTHSHVHIYVHMCEEVESYKAGGGY